MLRPLLPACIVFAALLITAAPPVSSAPYDGRPKIFMHVKPTTTKNPCAQGVLADYANAVVTGGLYPGSGPYYVYLVAARGSLTGLAGAQLGIDYQHGASGGATDGQGLDVYSWTLCGSLEFHLEDWPQPGSGNMVTWATCQTGETAVLGYFYVAAYAPDSLSVIARPVDGAAKVAGCPTFQALMPSSGATLYEDPSGDPTGEINLKQKPPQGNPPPPPPGPVGEGEFLLDPGDLGLVAFTASGDSGGCNPFLENCAPVPPPCTIPDPAYCSVPFAFIMSPDGSAASSVSVGCVDGPLSGVTVYLGIDPTADARVRWGLGQPHPLIAAVTDGSGTATFHLAGGLCPRVPGAVQVVAGGVPIGTAPLISPDAVNDLGQTPDDSCFVSCGDLAVTSEDVAFHAANLGSSDACSDFDGNGIVDAADTSYVAGFLGVTGSPDSAWMPCVPTDVSNAIRFWTPYDSLGSGGEKLAFFDAAYTPPGTRFALMNTDDVPRDLLFRWSVKNPPPDFNLAPYENLEECRRMQPRTLEYVQPPPFWEQLDPGERLGIGLDGFDVRDGELLEVDTECVEVVEDGNSLGPCPTVEIVEPTGDDWMNLDDPWKIRCASGSGSVMYPPDHAEFYLSKLDENGEPTTWQLIGEDLDPRANEVNTLEEADESLDGIALDWTPPASMMEGSYAIRVDLYDARGCVSRDTVKVAVPISVPSGWELLADAPESEDTGNDAPVEVSPGPTTPPARAIYAQKKVVTNGSLEFNVAPLNQFEVVPKYDSGIKSVMCGPTSATSIIMAMALCDSGLVKENGQVLTPEDIARWFKEETGISQYRNGCTFNQLAAAMEKWFRTHKSSNCTYKRAKGSSDTRGASSFGFSRVHGIATSCAFTIIRVNNHFVVVDSVGKNQNAVPNRIRIMDPWTGERKTATFDTQNKILSWQVSGTTFSGPVKSVLGFNQNCKKTASQGNRPVPASVTTTPPFPGLPDYPPLDRLQFAGWDSVLADTMPGLPPHTILVTVPLDASAGDAMLVHLALLDSAWAWGDTVLVIDVTESVSGSGPPDGGAGTALLRQNYPNPFRNGTVIPFLATAEPGDRPVQITVHSVDGRLVRTLLEGTVRPGLHLLPWDGTGDRGQRLASGLYLIRLAVEGRSEVRRAVLMR